MNITTRIPTIIDGKMEWYSKTSDMEWVVSTAVHKLKAVKFSEFDIFWYYRNKKGEIRKATDKELAILGAGMIDNRGIEYSTWEGLFTEKINGPLPSIYEALNNENLSC